MARLLVHIEIDAACAAAGGFFRTDNLPRWILPFAVVHVVLQDIIESYDIKPLDHLTTSCIRNGRVASRVEQTGIFPHGSCDARTLDGIFYTPFLIAVAPEYH